ncbi:FtsW/RodA/SpoVE family cell cycle protein [Flaviflexus massiliensis]|uniref:FtsW/RodA/SpoVE family cell cycle protein n=1 Tax=Flaviflexus massiliensis TaxID=1522309 RepID=UPI0006D5B3F9|nr:putative peptidoglycan glycosyltransferase FtsW [Flaviflexus massiliensis]
MSVTLSAEDERARDVIRQAVLLVLSATLILTVIGIVMVFSATSVTSISQALVYDNPAARFAEAQRQLTFGIVGLILLPIAAWITPRFYERFAWPIFIAGIGLQLLVLTPLGMSSRGNNNWVNIGGFTLQPSEFLKLAAALWLAVMVGRLAKSDMSDMRKVAMPAGAGALIALGGVLAGRDMGTAIIFVLMYGVLFWLAGIPGRWVAIIAICVAVVAVLLIAMEPSRLNRVADYAENIFITPDVYDPTQSEYAMWAFGTGGIGGVGLGASREKWNYLPEAHNDFIFAVIGEELGLAGCFAIIILFVVLGFGLFRIATHHRDRWVRYFVAMIAVWLTGQALLNMMVVTGVLPVFGVPLPFISQGGSSLIACLLAVGVVLSMALRQPGVAQSLRLSKTAFKSVATVRSTK